MNKKLNFLVSPNVRSILESAIVIVVCLFLSIQNHRTIPAQITVMIDMMLIVIAVTSIVRYFKTNKKYNRGLISEKALEEIIEDARK